MWNLKYGILNCFHELQKKIDVMFSVQSET